MTQLLLHNEGEQAADRPRFVRSGEFSGKELTECSDNNATSGLSVIGHGSHARWSARDDAEAATIGGQTTTGVSAMRN